MCEHNIGLRKASILTPMSPTTLSKLSVKDEICREEASVPAEYVILEGNFELTLETNGIYYECMSAELPIPSHKRSST